MEPLDPLKIEEYVAHSWYSYEGGDGESKPPMSGETTPNYTGPEPPYDLLDTDGKYSWLKAPRYDDIPVVVGPLARMLVAYGSGHPRVRELVDLVLSTLRVGPAALFSTLGRTAARGIETVVLAEQSLLELDRLIANISGGDTDIHNGELWEPMTWPSTAEGFGMHEAPRGSLSHWVRIEDQRIAHYQIVVRPRGMPGLATATATAEPTSRRCWEPLSPMSSSRWRSCGRCTRSIRVWRVRRTSSMATGTRSWR